MATNVSYASNDAILESLILHSLPDFGEHGDGILNANFLTAMLKEKGCYEEVEGGLEFWYGISKAESSNFKTQGKNDDMTADAQDPSARLRFAPKIMTGAVVLNELDQAMNRGRAAVKQFAMTLREQAESTIKNFFESLFWAGTPGTNDPESVPSLISATPTTGSIGGLSRVGNAYLQNYANTDAITSIGAQAGIAALEKTRILTTNGQSTPDLICMSDLRFAALVGYLSTLMRWKPNDKMAQLRITTIQMGDATIGYSSTRNLGTPNDISDSYVYLINSKNMKVKRLVTPEKDGWSKEFERIGTKLNKAVFYRWFFNLVTNCPRAHAIMTSVTG